VINADIEQLCARIAAPGICLSLARGSSTYARSARTQDTWNNTALSTPPRPKRSYTQRCSPPKKKPRRPHRHQPRESWRMVCRIFKPPFSLVAWVADVTRIDTITRIKLDAVNQSFAMLAQGFLPYQILEFMTGPYNSRQTLHPAVANARLAAISQRHLATSSQHSQQVSQTPDQASSFVLPSIERPTEPQPRGRTVSSTWRKIEPKLTGQSVLNHADAPGTYTQMQQRFEQGDLARLVEQKHPLYMMSREGALSAVHNTPFSYEAMSRMQTMTPSMEDATLQASRRISQPTAHLLLQQATSRMGSVTSNSQGAALASHTNQAMSQPQRATPSMQDTASQVQDYMMAMSQPQSATPNMRRPGLYDDHRNTGRWTQHRGCHGKHEDQQEEAEAEYQD
jgi:hypothetical protein